MSRSVLVFLLATGAGHAACQKKAVGFFESAVRFTTDAEMAFVGPSWSLGGGAQVNKHWSFSVGYTFFRDRYSQGGYEEFFRIHTVDFLPVFHFLNPFDSRKGFFVGAGLCWQSRKATYNIENPQHFAGSYTLGYQFPVMVGSRAASLAVDWKGFGPYREQRSIEILTQFMLGVRLRY